jgi:peptidylprolyl isomerase
MIRIVIAHALVLLCLTSWAQTKKGSTPSKTNTESTAKEITTASGLKYRVVKKGDGKQATRGSKVIVHYTGTLTNGTKFDSSKDRNQPFSFKLGIGQVIQGWEEGIALMREGEVAILTIPPSIGYGDRDMGSIPPNSTLIFEVELIAVHEAVKPFDVKGKDTISLPSGLKYIVEGNGRKDAQQAKEGDVAVVHYTGYFLDGKVFDSSIEREEPATFTLGGGRLIRGWEEGVMRMKIGDRYRLIIPPHLAYGQEGINNLIPPNSTLIFDVELVELKEGFKPFDVKGKDTITTPSGLKYIIVEGTQDDAGKPEVNEIVEVHYTGYLASGKIFDSSYERGEPMQFMYGTGRMIKGWEEGISHMSIGSKYRLIIPSNLAYGEQGAGNGIIPPNATLIFDVELLGIIKDAGR